MKARFPLVCALVVGSLTFSSIAAPPISRPWNQDVIYFALTDRFYDGDPTNDVPAGSDPSLYDRTQTNIDRYHGGDFRGLELALGKGYFNDLGVTALWITPPVRNVWYSADDANDKPKTGYHGYWAQDFLDIDPHLVSRCSLDGSREYPDSRDGRMQHYKDLVALAHARGIKVIQDIVCNHAGPVFYYDANGNGKFDRDQKAEWIQPFRHDGPYPDAHWAETPEWDQHRAAPAGPVTVLGREIKAKGSIGNLESYGRRGMSPDSLGKSDGEEIECDFFGLRDFWTAPDSPHFDALVDDFVEVYAFYVEEIGVDGFRIDTVKHVHHAFWDAFTERLRRRLGPDRAKTLILFGEVYDGNPVKVGEYTYRLGWPADRRPCLDSLLDFPFCYAVRAYLRNAGQPFGATRDLTAAMRALTGGPAAGVQARSFYNPTPGSDGLDSGQKMVNFIENHDGLNRFRVQGVSERRNLLANALLLLSPGIPCLYYGTEAGLQDVRGKVDSDAETGRLTFIHAGEGPSLDAVKKQDGFRGLASLCEWRRTLPALTTGSTSLLAVDGSAGSADGVFAFARGGGGDGIDPMIVVVNASGQERSTGAPNNAMKLVSENGRPLLSPGDRLERLPIAGLDAPGTPGPVPQVRWQDDVPRIELRLDPESVNIYRRVH